MHTHIYACTYCGVLTLCLMACQRTRVRRIGTQDIGLHCCRHSSLNPDGPNSFVAQHASFDSSAPVQRLTFASPGRATVNDLCCDADPQYTI